MIALIEHGETDLDARGENHGHRDAPLNAEGHRQAVRLGARMRRAMPKPTLLFHSLALRATQTARIAGAIAGVPVQLAKELAPLRSGSLGAGPANKVAQRLAPYSAAPERKIPGGEAVATWRARHLAFMHRLLASGQPVAAITHSNVIGSIRGGSAGALCAMTHSPAPAEPAAVITNLSMRPRLPELL